MITRIIIIIIVNTIDINIYVIIITIIIILLLLLFLFLLSVIIVVNIYLISDIFKSNYKQILDLHIEIRMFKSYKVQFYMMKCIGNFS